jgi:hypothetical protein
MPCFAILAGLALSDDQCGGLAYALQDGALTVTGDGVVTSECAAPYLPQVTGAVTLKPGITKIDKGALSGLKARRVTLPPTLTVIAEYAFADAAISSLTLPPSLESIEAYAFLSAKFSSARIRIPALTNPSPLAFLHAQGIEAFEVHPDNPFVASDAPGCLLSKDYTVLLRFPGGSVARTHDVNYNVTSLSPHAPFSAATKLTEIDLRLTRITEVPEAAFAGLSALTKVLLPVHVLSIGANAFAGTRVSGLNLPERVATIAPGAFLSAPIKDLTVSFRSKTLQVEDGMLYSIDQRALLYAPPGEPYDQILLADEVAEIRELAFADVQAPGLILPPRVARIGARAFVRARLAYLVLPPALRGIGAQALANATVEWLAIGAAAIEADALANATVRNVVYTGEAPPGAELCAALAAVPGASLAVPAESAITEVCGRAAGKVAPEALPWTNAPDNVDRTPLVPDDDDDDDL